MRALILANGDQPPIHLIQKIRRESDIFVATDGAANYLYAHGIIPDVVVGDLDSLLPLVAEELPSDVLIPALDQEASDLDKALSLARSRGATHATILGAGGGRMDHTLTALSLLLKHQPPLEIVVRYPASTLRLVREECALDGAPGDTLSLIVFAPADGVQLTGVQWPLGGETLLPGSRGVSNRMTSNRATLRVGSGWVLLSHEGKRLE